jgi:hypothetical protein
VFADPLTKAINFCVAEGCSEALSGLSEIVTPCGLILLDFTSAQPSGSKTATNNITKDERYLKLA